MASSSGSKTRRGATGVTFDAVRSAGLRLSGVEEGTTHGSPALKVNDKLMAWIPVNKKDVEPGTLAVRIDIEQRDALLADAPDVYYLTEHYRDYAAVLVRLSRVDRAALADLLLTAWRFLTNGAKRRSPARRASKSPGA